MKKDLSKKKSNSLLLLQIGISLLYRLNKVKNNCAIILIKFKKIFMKKFDNFLNLLLH